jgi:hypothetical protein
VSRTVKGYLVLHPKWSRYTHVNGPFAGEKRIDSVHMSKVLARKPAKSTLATGDVVVEVSIDIAEAAFYPVHVPTINVLIESPVDQPQPPVGVVTKTRRRSAAAEVIE